MNALARLADAAVRDADNADRALAWLIEQWIHDVDREHADWCLAGLRHEDPELFDVLDAVWFTDTGEQLLSDAPAVMGGESAEPGPHAPGPALHSAGGSVVGPTPAPDGSVGSPSTNENGPTPSTPDRPRTVASAVRSGPAT